MDQKTALDLPAFRELMAAIRTESERMKKVILSEEEEKEENEILCKFKSVVEVQVYSTMMNIVKYQVQEWRELIDE